MPVEDCAPMKSSLFSRIVGPLMVVALMSIGLNLHSQTKLRTDSLIQLIHLENIDSIYISLNFDVADELLNNSPDSASIFIRQAMKRSQQSGDKKNLALGYNYLGNLSVQEAHYVTALEHFQSSLSIYKEIGDKKGQANLTNNIGIIYTHLEEHDKALGHYKESFRLNHELGNWENASYSLINTASEYLALDQLDSARAYYYQLKFLHDLHNEISDDQMILGEIYLKEGKADSSITCFQRAIEKCLQEKDIYVTSAIRLSLAKAHILKHEYVVANSYLNMSEKSSVQNEYNDLLLEIMAERTTLLQSIGNYSGALENQKKYIAFKDSLDRINRFNRISELNAKYESEKQEMRISRQQQQLQSKNSLIISSLIGLGALVIISGLILFNLLKKRKVNATLRNQNSQIRQQRQKIISSLNYAKKIQRSILVPEQVIRNVLPNSFVFFKPKDIVSGDFYWFKKNGDEVILATVDCTGHGVPGAFMSLIANSQLEKAVNEKKLSDPGDIMKYVHEQILIVLNQDDSAHSVQDGLDITICLINTRTNSLRFAGSGNAIYLVKGNEIRELKTENYGLAGEFFAKKASMRNLFASKSIQYETGTDLFMLTDGYLDQFGGVEKKKLNKPRFREFLKSLSQSNLHNAQQLCEQFFENWRGTLPQLDDVLLIGARL